ncbi:hypothetical protein ACLMJK_000860 [Lecanora helva]
MSGSNKRPWPDEDLNPSLPAKKARQDAPTGLQPLDGNNLISPSISSSPTLKGSVLPSSPPPPLQTLNSSDTDDTESTFSSENGDSITTDIGEGDSGSSTLSTSSSDDSDGTTSSQYSRNLHWQQMLINRQLYDSSTSTSEESFTSTSASISDDLSSSDVSSSSSSGLDKADETDLPLSSSCSSSSSSLSDTSTPPPLPPRTNPASLTAKNLSKLQQRLDSLLPKLQSANERLDKLAAEGRLGEQDIENVEGEGGEKGYIEMDLGLGVLEEKGEGRDEESGRYGDVEGKSKQAMKEDAIARLLHAPEGKKKSKVKIEEVDSG